MARKPRNAKLKSKNSTRSKRKGDLKSLRSEIGEDTSQVLPPGHRFDYEISNVAFCLLVSSYFENQETGHSLEKILRRELTKRIKNRSMSKVASIHFASIVDLARETPLAIIVKKILEVTWDEYLIISRHMIQFKEITYLERFNNFLDGLKKESWQINEIDKNFKGVFDNQESYIILDKDYKKFFNEAGQISKSFHIAAKSHNIHVMTEVAYQSGLVIYRNEMMNGLYNLVFYPENNLPGVAFSPPSVTNISHEI